MDLQDKQITVIGLGNSGLNAAILLNGLGARVMATDSGETPSIRKNRALLESKGVRVETGGHAEDFVRASELVVVSPGVEESSPAIIFAKKHGIPAIGEMELGYRFCKGRIIAITGTNGKSTVTTLTGGILKDGGRDTIVCGNIGNSLCGEIGRIGEDTLVVLEVSSFQLERIEEFKPYIAVILNITDDHMDRHAGFRDYFNQKLKIFRNQDEGDILVLNHDAENLRPVKGLARSRVIFYSRQAGKKNPFVDGMRLKGEHNAENVIAACTVGGICGISENSMKNTVAGFRALRHRFETVAVIDGVEYIDDSKGTTVDSAVRALESCTGPVILIAGGRDKSSDYTAARGAVKDKVSHLVLIGEARDAIRRALGGYTDIREARDMRDAVNTARGLAREGDIVLLSPMCSSFDMFRDYGERGEAFIGAVTALKRSDARAAMS